MNEYDVSIEVEKTNLGILYKVKIASDLLEINVIISNTEIIKLSEVKQTNWNSGALQIGTVAGVRAYWCNSGDNMISILIGNDDQTWDIGLRLPENIISMIYDEINI